MEIFAYDCKRENTISEIKPTMCISSMNKGKTHIGWVDIVR
jgi:hypothetical protein